MSQHIQHHPQQTQFVAYNPTPLIQQQQLPITHVAPTDIQRQVLQPDQQQQQQQQQQQAVVSSPPQASGSGSSSAPLVAKGDWTKELVQLAKTAELKKHALTLQLHTAHILSAHASLEQKGKAIQDLHEQKNKLESERIRLLNCLRDVNEDRDKVDLIRSTLEKECEVARQKIAELTEKDYAVAKADVDRLRQELGQPPLPTLQATLDEKRSMYLNERRLNGNEFESQTPEASYGAMSASEPAGHKRAGPISATPDSQAKRPRGRPKGSKNKTQP